MLIAGVAGVDIVGAQELSPCTGEAARVIEEAGGNDRTTPHPQEMQFQYISPCPPALGGRVPPPPWLAPRPPASEIPPPRPFEELIRPFATPSAGGGFQGRAFHEAFDGDLLAAFYRRTIITRQLEIRQISEQRYVLPGQGGLNQIIRLPIYGPVWIEQRRQVLIPVGGRYNGISITDNDSPRPTDRLYFHYSYYDGIAAQLNPGYGNVILNRPLLGFEKTFLDGNASIGLRLPFVQLHTPGGLADTQGVGDLTILTKYAIVNDRVSGDIVSAGFILTTPTGVGDVLLADGTRIPHSTLFQPWCGFVTVFDRFYVQGVSALIIPTSRRDTTLLTNSIAAGWWLYRSPGDRLLQGVVPIVELHVRTPLNNRNRDGVVFVPDMFNITTGVHLRFPRATLGAALCVPTIAPRPWNVEAIGNFTLWF
ncbi:MAG: hypothetical protein NZU63_01590 [Gemmataceae bacterium]|nr:hypothetical protein [Gemmataceae bacterium]